MPMTDDVRPLPEAVKAVLSDLYGSRLGLAQNVAFPLFRSGLRTRRQR
jgi:hypothetical protein